MREPTRQENRIAMMLIMLAFVRAGNIRFAEWQEINTGKRLWVIPAEKMEMLSLHIVPLSDWTLELLESLHTATGHGCYLLRTHSDGHISENTAGKIINGMGYKGIATPHGFRSLASSILNKPGFNPDAIEQQLAHIEDSKIRAAYNRADYMTERQQMMQWYSDYLRERYNAARALIGGKAPMQC